VDFIGDGRSLTKGEEKAIREFIKALKPGTFSRKKVNG